MVWKSIHAAKEVIRNGSRWKIGDGTKICVWNEPWLAREGNRRINSIPTEDMRNLSVADLLIPGLQEWDEELLEITFDADDVQAILATPPPTSRSMDTRIWDFTKDGHYSVSSRYRVAMETLVDRTQYIIPGNWKKIWDAPFHPESKSCFGEWPGQFFPLATLLTPEVL
ncbi:hypothetical protein LINPERPRIM_LOCUS1517 [Linum perenne]